MIKKDDKSEINSRDIYKFIDEEKFEKCVKTLISRYDVAKKKDFFKNKIDPFSAIVQMNFQDKNFDAWEDFEKERQLQKSLQNHIGKFHQDIITNLNDWEKMEISDAINKKKKIFVEVKNKFNTVTGEKEARVYDNLASNLKKYPKYKAYYLYIIRENKYVDEPFTPSDNTKKKSSKKKKRKKRQDLRKIDGVSFYKKITKDDQFLKKLYTELFIKLLAISGKNSFSNIKDDDRFNEFFKKTFD
mgnify:CR=1 FL=1|tara:strand:+ start:953 stop:1684 length:732 start_codon:yes stop_codon:yes gene_type:complete